MSKVSYLGVAGLGKIVPISFGEVVDSIFIEITNADSKDGFVIEYEGIVKMYQLMMESSDGCRRTTETSNQFIEIITNHGLTELTISLKKEWKECGDIKELESGLQVQIPDKSVILVPTDVLIKKLFRIVTAKERKLFYFQ